MKRLSVLLAAMLLMYACNKDYDDSTLTNRVENLENRVIQLEELCKQMNTNISSLHTLVKAIENKDYVTGVTSIIKDGKEVGYTITFTQSEPITIYHGTDGKDGIDGEDGADGITPTIGIKTFTDGIYYWTLNGEWLLDENRNKVKAVGTDGKDGQDGKDGTNGSTGVSGKDGVTPQLKIENSYWYVSYDRGTTWTKLSATTNDNSSSSDTTTTSNDTFQKVEINDNNIIFTLKDGTSFTLPKYEAVEINFDNTEQGISAGRTIRIPYTLINANSATKVSISSDGNYKVRLEEQTITGGIIVVTAPDHYTDGYINVMVSDGNSHVSLNVISFYKWEMTISGQGQQHEPIYSTSTDGGIINIPLDVNFDYTVEIPTESADWISTSIESRAIIRHEMLKLIIKPNTTLTARSCIIRLKPTTGTESFIEITIQQSSAIFSIDKSHFIAKAVGETFIINIQSTAGLKVNVPSSDTWITTSTTSTKANYILTLNIAENTSTSRRNSIIELYSADKSTLLAIIDVAQLAIDEDKLKDLVFQVSANFANNFTVYLPIGTLYREPDCIINWGDGKQEHFIFDKQRNSIYHQYDNLNSATEFEVRVSGIVPVLNPNMPSASLTNTILAVKQWGDTQLTSIDGAFSGVTFLKSIPEDILGAFANIKSFNHTFSGCSNLSSIPEKLFSKCIHTTSFYGTFSECSSITVIPEDLFKNCTKITEFSNTFSACSSLTNIPEKLFSNCKNTTNFEGTFSRCSNLTTIPEILFKNCINAISFSRTFYECSALTSIPENLFKNCRNATIFGGIFSSSGITFIPENLFKNCINATDFGTAFHSCQNLTSIPQKLFASCPNATKFNDVFMECSQITTIPEMLFTACPNVTNFDYVFAGCKLNSIPVNLFDNNRRVSCFRGTFQDCSSVAGESPYQS